MEKIAVSIYSYMNNDIQHGGSQGRSGKTVSNLQHKCIRATDGEYGDEVDKETKGRGRNVNGYFVFPVNEFPEKDCYEFNTGGQ